MKRREIVEILKSTGIPITYYQWDEDKDGDGPALPYIVYYYPSSEGEAADDRQWSQKSRLNVELYTETKDFDMEARVDAVLGSFCVFDKEETYLSDEHMYEVLYMTEVLINEQNSVWCKES